MPDPITTLGLGKTTTDIIKETLDFARRAKNSELAEKLIDLYQNFVQLSESNQQLKNEVHELRGEITALNKRPEIAAKLKHVLSSGSYFLKETDGTETGPFCSVCWDVDGRLVRQSKFGMQTICQYCVRRSKH